MVSVNLRVLLLAALLSGTASPAGAVLSTSAAPGSQQALSPYAPDVRHVEGGFASKNALGLKSTGLQDQAGQAAEGSEAPPFYQTPYFAPLAVLVTLLAGAFIYSVGHRRLESRLTELTEQLAERTHQVEEANQTLKRLARLDSVTGVANHSQFQDFLRGEWRRALREASPISVIMIDIDHFKEYNDRLGHPAGDECLTKVATTLSGAINRPGDLVARYGGEEFGVILSRTDGTGAYRVAHKLCAAVEALAIAHPDSPVAKHVTVSLGVASATPALESNWEELELVAGANRALSQAKQAGRNRVVAGTASEHAPPGA